MIQPTVVDPAAFLVWKNEAFDLWESSWASLYDEDSRSRQLLDEIRSTFFLVNIVDHDFVGGDIFAIFRSFLAEEGKGGDGRKGED